MNAGRRRIIVISDLHIGGEEQPMLGHPELLTTFLRRLNAYSRVGSEEVELVINGDFIDFLAEQPSEAWTIDETSALEKLDNVFKRHEALFGALAAAVASLRRFSVLLGNHDIELAYPRVRDALLQHLGTEQHRCLFVQSNESYRVGDVLVEHGNRYDSWNAIDHDGLRETVSAASRKERILRGLQVCPGSQLVHEVMNPLKQRYHFIDLLKPEDKLVVLLLTTFEPELKRDLSTIFPAASAYVAQSYRKAVWKLADVGPAPGEPFLVSRQNTSELPNEVRDAFSDELRNSDGALPVGAVSRLRKLFLTKQADGLKARLERDEPIDPSRLRKLQVALRAKLEGDTTFDEKSESGEYALAAKSMIEVQAAKVVVMGHTHLRRNVELAGGRYVNTGTWADLIRVNDDILADTDEGRASLTEWLRRLVTDELDGIRVCEPGYANVLVDGDGHVVDERRPMLCDHDVDFA